MAIIVFDIECADGRNICSFGYVIADNNLEVKVKRDIIINPRIGRIRVHKLAPPLPYPIGEFHKAPDFTFCYDEIKGLLSNPENKVFGFSTMNDAIFLNTACQRYGLPHIEFKFYDCQRMYGKLHDQGQQIGLETLANQYEIEVEHIHKSDDDALTTLAVLSKMCKENNCNIDELLALDSDSYAYNRAEYIEFSTAWKKEKAITLGANLKGVNLRIHSRVILWQHRFKEKTQLNGVAGKTFCMSRLFERIHFKESVYLIKLINENGGKYVSNVEKSNIFVSYGEPSDRQLTAELHPDTISVIEMKALYALLGVTKEEVIAGGDTINLESYLTQEDRMEIEGKKPQNNIKVSPVI
ncbi:MAG: hypothetical protein R3Y23_07050 [Bacillota bacterium]